MTFANKTVLLYNKPNSKNSIKMLLKRIEEKPSERNMIGKEKIRSNDLQHIITNCGNKKHRAGRQQAM